MKQREKTCFNTGLLFTSLFAVWTVLVKTVDVQPVGPQGTAVGFAAWNSWFHRLTGVHMQLYAATDWLGLIPVLICVIFGCLGMFQLFQRKDLRKVDVDILLLGIYYGIVIVCYLLFEMVPINFRPVLIEGRLEASYPSSTTLLVLSVIPTLAEQGNRRLKEAGQKKILGTASALFSLFMVMGRLISGVHWLTDIVGSVFLSGGLFCLYRAGIQMCCKEK